jgi:hypothetical protein
MIGPGCLFPRIRPSPEPWASLRKLHARDSVRPDPVQTFPTPIPSRHDFVLDDLLEGLAFANQGKGTIGLAQDFRCLGEGIVILGRH